MRWNDDFFQFIGKHSNDDTHKLRLKKGLDFSFDISLAIDQIELKKKVAAKLPQWSTFSQVIYPSPITVEQCSSEVTAKYKQSLVCGNHLCDMTGGLGVDTFYFAQVTHRVTYIERYLEYCDIARHNFEQLKANNIQVINGDSRDTISRISTPINTFYIDPARRAESNQRVFALSDCEPDMTILLPFLLEHGQRVIIKASPMIDVAHSLHLFPSISQVHIVAYKNDCKELLFVIDKENKRIAPEIICLNFTGNNTEKFSFIWGDESKSQSNFQTQIARYLYEPNVAVLKAGVFNLIASTYNLCKVAQNSHLYVSDECRDGFPGRKFKIIEHQLFTGKTMNALVKQYPSASIVSRNFTLKVDEIRKRWQWKESDELFLFFTTDNQNKKVIFVCHKLN